MNLLSSQFDREQANDMTAKQLSSANGLIRRSIRSYHAYVQDMLARRAFVYALIIVPVSSLSTLSVGSLEQQQNIIRDAATQEALAQSNAALSDGVTADDASLAPDEGIRFTFDDIFSSHEKERLDIAVFPTTDFHSSWDGDTLIVEPQDLWELGKTYSVALRFIEGEESGVEKDELEFEREALSKIYHFRTHGLPKIVAQYPERGDVGLVIEPGTEVSATLDRPIEDYDFRIVSEHTILKTAITSHPFERKVSIVLEDGVPEAQGVGLVLYAKHKDQGTDDFAPIGEMTFSALLPQPSEWPEDSDERVALSLERTVPKIKTGKYIDINLAARLTTLFEDGKPIASFVNSPGAAETPTPVGEYKIENKGLKPVSRSFGVYLPFWMAFTSDGLYGIHDLVEWPAGHPDYPDFPDGGKESVSSIDAAVSPGCVRHNTTNSGEIYHWTDVGTPVIIY